MHRVSIKSEFPLMMNVGLWHAQIGDPFLRMCVGGRGCDLNQHDLERSLSSMLHLPSAYPRALPRNVIKFTDRVPEAIFPC